MKTKQKKFKEEIKVIYSEQEFEVVYNPKLIAYHKKTYEIKNVFTSKTDYNWGLCLGKINFVIDDNENVVDEQLPCLGNAGNHTIIEIKKLYEEKDKIEKLVKHLELNQKKFQN